MRNIIIVFVIIYASVANAQQYRIDIKDSLIEINLSGNVIENTKVLRDVLDDSLSKQCFTVVAYGVIEILPDEFYKLTWVKAIEIYGPFDTNDLKLKKNIFVLEDKINSFSFLESLKIESVGIKKISKNIVLKNLKSLTIKDSNIKKVPVMMFSSNYLEYLNLSRNSIRKIPYRIRELQNLEYLIFEINMISKIPISISCLKNLKTLLLSANNIKIVPNELTLLTSLEYFEIGENPIEIFPKELNLIKNLEIIR